MKGIYNNDDTQLRCVCVNNQLKYESMNYLLITEGMNEFLHPALYQLT